MQDREQAFSVAAVKVEHLSPVSTLEQPRGTATDFAVSLRCCDSPGRLGDLDGAGVC